MTLRELARRRGEPSKGASTVGTCGPPPRALGVWGAGAYTWSGEERPRVAGFPVDLTGRQRVLGFPADPPGKPLNVTPGGRPGVARRPKPAKQHARVVIAVVAILGRRGAG